VDTCLVKVMLTSFTSPGLVHISKVTTGVPALAELRPVVVVITVIEALVGNQKNGLELVPWSKAITGYGHWGKVAEPDIPTRLEPAVEFPV
jgi:hypothetical protein